MNKIITKIQNLWDLVKPIAVCSDAEVHLELSIHLSDEFGTKFDAFNHENSCPFSMMQSQYANQIPNRGVHAEPICFVTGVPVSSTSQSHDFSSPQTYSVSGALR